MRKALPAIVVALVMALGVGQIPAYAGQTLVWPVPASHTLSQGYHDGNAIDISASTGTTVVAAASGKVTTIYKCNQTHQNYGDCNGFGTGLVILGDDGRAYQYAHMQAGSIPANVYYGARVSAGQKIGAVGMTGYATGPHLHFGISYNSQYWKAGPNPANETYGSTTTNTTVTIDNLSVTNLAKTDAQLNATAHKSAGTTVSSCGIYLGTSPSNMTKRNTEALGATTNSYRSGTGFDIYYDLTGELGITLNPGTTYYYKFYCTVGNKEYTSGTGSFTTAADPKPAVAQQPVTTTTQQPSAVMAGKATQSMTASPTVKTYKKATLNKKAQTYTVNVKNAKGKVSFKSKSKYLKVTSAGKVTVKKGTPKGYYTFSVTAAGNTTYSAHTILLGVKVK